MHKYSISTHSYNQAKALGVTIKPSESKNKKIDVYKGDKKIASIGDIRYKDYPTYMKEDKDLANKHRAAYKKRHHKDLNKTGTPGYYANNILW